MSTQDEQISAICERIRAIRSGLATLPVTPDRSATRKIKELFCHGDGLLPELRPPPGTQDAQPSQRILQRIDEHRENDGEGSDEEDDVNSDDGTGDAAADPGGRLDQDKMEDPNGKGRLGEEKAIEYLRSLENVITARQQVQPVTAPPCLNVQPFPYQLRATALCLHSEQTPFKGMIYADLPGLGKTLALLMTFIIGRKPGDGPSLVVAPASCCRQWMEEIRVQLKEGTLRALLLTDSSLMPHELYRYDVIITSYNYVASEASRMAKFDQQMDDYDNKKSSIIPKRPKVALLSGIWKMDGVQHLGRYIALDESHAVKNSGGRTYTAIKQLRELFHVCLPTTGTPLDNTWKDVFALLSLLRGHPFVSLLRMREVFTDAHLDKSGKNKSLHVPKEHKLARLVRLLHACTLSRPASLFTRNLPALIQEKIRFDLPKEEKELSNEAFEKYNQSLGMRFDDAAYGGKADGESSKGIRWSALIKATQLAFHPGLPRIMELARKATKQKEMSDVALDDVQFSEKEQEEYDTWRSWLRIGDNSRSARVDVIVDIVNKTRDRRPDDAILVLDESVFFLDILDAAFARMHEPVDVFRYDGSQDPAKRHQVMQAFSTASGTRVMLATRGAGGQGLNVQCANVVVRCGPWWKASWEKQALARSYRPGQTKPVWEYSITAAACKVETHKRAVSGKKNKVNESIMALLTMEDDQQPGPWDE